MTSCSLGHDQWNGVEMHNTGSISIGGVRCTKHLFSTQAVLTKPKEVLQAEKAQRKILQLAGGKAQTLPKKCGGPYIPRN